MFIEDIEFGMKVVPVTYSPTSIRCLPPNRSVVWKRCIKANKQYLVVIKLPDMSRMDDRIRCAMVTDGGDVEDYDNFREWDLEQYNDG